MDVQVDPGSRWGSYVLDERLAVGGMAEVFRARRIGAHGFAREVCIKRILPNLSGTRAFVEMFADEARIGSRLRHTNIVSVDDFGVIDGQHFLCMEYVPGVDARQFMRAVRNAECACPIDVAVHLTECILKALDHAHHVRDTRGEAMAIVHRDLSPQNILLSYCGTVKLADFGIARAVSRTHHTAEHVLKGKVTYMSPEQACGAALDSRTDLFSLGIVMFELLAGVRPFTGRDRSEVLANLMRNERAALREIRPDVPVELASLVDRLLRPRPDDRFATARDALTMLASVPDAGTGADTLVALLADLFPRHDNAVARDSLERPALALATDPATVAALELESRITADLTPVSLGASVIVELRTAEAALPVRATTSRVRARRVGVTGLVVVTLVGGVAIEITRMESRVPLHSQIVRAGLALASMPQRVPLPSIPTLAAASVPVTTTADLPAVHSPRSRVRRSTAINARVRAVDTARTANGPRAPRLEHTATLRIIALPWGEVFVDGEYRGHSPIDVHVTAGTHSVRVTGGIDAIRRLHVEPNGLASLVLGGE